MNKKPLEPPRCLHCDCRMPDRRDAYCEECRRQNEVFRDPQVKDSDAFRVRFNNKICSPMFNSKGAAVVYLEMLIDGRRKPEYAE